MQSKDKNMWEMFFPHEGGLTVEQTPGETVLSPSLKLLKYWLDKPRAAWSDPMAEHGGGRAGTSKTPSNWNSSVILRNIFQANRMVQIESIILLLI